MGFTALKPCRFGGTDYLIGDTIPDIKIHPNKAEALRQMGVVTGTFTIKEFDDPYELEDWGIEDGVATPEEQPAESTETPNPAEDKDEEQPKRRGRRRAE